jgi:transposase-like protein
MASYKRISLEIKNEILKKIKDGQTAKDLAPLYGISTKTIYNWLRDHLEGGVSPLEIGKLRKENEFLLGLVGRLTVEVSKSKKKLRH